MLGVATILANDPPDPAPEDCWSKVGNFDRWLIAEFQHCRAVARSKPLWIQRADSPKFVEWIGWCLALPDDQIPINQSAKSDRRASLIAFCQWCSECEAAEMSENEWLARMEETFERAHAFAHTLSVEVKRRCAGRPNLIGPSPSPRTTKPESQTQTITNRLGQLVRAECERRAAISAEACQPLVDWLIAAGIVLEGSSFKEAMSVLHVLSDDEALGIARALGIQEAPTTSTNFAKGDRVQHVALGAGTVTRTSTDAFTVTFDRRFRDGSTIVGNYDSAQPKHISRI